MKYLFLLLFFIYVRFVSSQVISNEIRVAEKSKCSSMSEQIVSRCLQPILAYATSIQDKSDGGGHFSLQGGDIFKKLCQLYSDFKECTSSVNCHSISMEAVEASYGYMCGPGFKLFEEHATCFAEVENQKEYVVCKNAASQSMDDALKVKKDDMDLYFHKLCSIMDNYLRCCRPFVQEKCGPEAWQLVSQVRTLTSFTIVLIIKTTTISL